MRLRFHSRPRPASSQVRSIHSESRSSSTHDACATSHVRSTHVLTARHDAAAIFATRSRDAASLVSAWFCKGRFPCERAGREFRRFDFVALGLTGCTIGRIEMAEDLAVVERLGVAAGQHLFQHAAELASGNGTRRCRRATTSPAPLANNYNGAAPAGSCARPGAPAPMLAASGAVPTALLRLRRSQRGLHAAGSSSLRCAPPPTTRLRRRRIARRSPAPSSRSAANRVLQPHVSRLDRADRRWCACRY